MNAELKELEEELDQAAVREKEPTAVPEDYPSRVATSNPDEGYLSRFLIVFLVILITVGFLVIYGLVLSP